MIISIREECHSKIRMSYITEKCNQLYSFAINILLVHFILQTNDII